MTLTLKGVLFLAAAIIFFLDFLLGFVGAPYEPYRPTSRIARARSRSHGG